MHDLKQAMGFILGSFPKGFRVGDGVDYSYTNFSQSRVNLPESVSVRINDAFEQLVIDEYLDAGHRLTEKGYRFLLLHR